MVIPPPSTRRSCRLVPGQAEVPAPDRPRLSTAGVFSTLCMASADDQRCRHDKGKTYETHLLRRSYRQDGKVRTETLRNISHLPADLIDLVRRGLAGERFLPTDGFEIRRSLPHGGVVAVLDTLRSLGLEQLLDRRPSRQRDLVVAMIAARLLAPGSKLAVNRCWGRSTLGSVLGVADADEDELYAAMDWLLERQERIEARLAARHLASGSLVPLRPGQHLGRGKALPARPPRLQP